MDKAEKKHKEQTAAEEHIVVGILAHVDAGKTTLSEGMLYLTGKIRKLGRVDHRNAFLDHDPMERKRGITIFSKQAVFSRENQTFTLLDTPGHTDFGAEMERTLQVLDYAILVISGPDGIQGHTMTLWKLLAAYKVPVFLFINKMDQEGTDRERLLALCRQRLDDACVDFTGFESPDIEAGDRAEEIAMTDEAVMDYYLEKGRIPEEETIRLIRERKLFPCYFGSALQLTGVSSLLDGMSFFMRMPEIKEETGGRIFKIMHGPKGERLTFAKVTGGSLRVKSFLPGHEGEKIDQIRIYSGETFRLVPEAVQGEVCALTGLSETESGQGYGFERTAARPVLRPVMTRVMNLPEGTDAADLIRKLGSLEEEDPQLQILWDAAHREISVCLMGDVQTEILTGIIKDRFGLDVTFGPGRVVYRETIAGPVEGCGHYEPLRHYAEVHLRLEPLPRGRGLEFSSSCSEDLLDRNWQRLILTHLQERVYPGVLTGSPITDMKITLTAGRAHLKHTEGGDFRQAVIRALRQGLMSADSILLEPWYDFVLEIPTDQVGRAMSDIQKMHGSFSDPAAADEDTVILEGKLPAACAEDYPREVLSYSRGRGRLQLTFSGYETCHDTERVISETAYDPDRDMDFPSGSIFCSHGAGYFVPWDQAAEKMHISAPGHREDTAPGPRTGGGGSSMYEEDAAFRAVFLREFGSRQAQDDHAGRFRRRNSEGSRPEQDNAPVRKSTRTRPRKKYLLVDGYNVIYAWESLAGLAEADLGAARDKLTEILSNYQAFMGYTLILVFDAYKVEGNPGEIIKKGNVYVVFTKEAETADQYIEKTTHEIAGKHDVLVATSDGLEQVIVMGQGAMRISARDLYDEVARVEEEIRRIAEEKRAGRRYLFDDMDKELHEHMENVRLGKVRREEDGTV